MSFITYLDAFSVQKKVRTTTQGDEHVQQVELRELDGTVSGVAVKLGDVAEAAPATLTASSGLNGLLRLIAGRLAPVTPVYWITTASTNAHVFKASAGVLRSMVIHNRDTSSLPIFVKVHNTSGAPTPGTTAVVFPVGVQAGMDVVVPIPAGGISFSAGISISITRLVADNDMTAVTAGSLVSITHD